MHNNLVTIENVTFGYDEGHPILNDISLTIPQGLMVAIMGGSGCGKTTLLRLISGQLKPQTGRVRVFDQDITSLSDRNILKLRTKMGMLFQFGALFTDMSVYENVAFSLKEHTDLPETLIKKIVAMKLQAVGLFGTQEMMPQELSGGMARRIALARSLALDPELMMYDEPFTGLDPISLNVSAMLIHKLNGALGQTSILVTHDIESSLKIADYIYFMANGKIIAQGTPLEVKNTTNPAVRQFIEGSVNGPFSFEYPTKINYAEYLEAL
ncbi:MAG: ABC transporter ATP-binding protein [Burkholderiales bacterium]|nr:ABC transporter ATP-binding protein [Burkholderiales bacterium]